MGQIQIHNLTFSYEGSYETIFENMTVTLDTDWKLGLIGRNGRGKTTLLKLLLGELHYEGKITASQSFTYFPFQVQQKERNTIEIIEEIYPQYELWEVCRELQYLEVDLECLYRPFILLSYGEQTKVLLAVLFLQEHAFLLIDEPTNHLDIEGREQVANYLQKKKGYILISHDRAFLDRCVDHIMAINKKSIEVVKGNFTSWYDSKCKRDAYELQENERRKQEIKRLENAARQKENWANKVEKSKKGQAGGGSKVDRGYIGHKSAKMMKRGKVLERRIEQEIEKKNQLLKDIEETETLKIYPKSHYKQELITIRNGAMKYGEMSLSDEIHVTIQQGNIYGVQGKNGHGKSTLLKLILWLIEQKEQGCLEQQGKKSSSLYEFLVLDDKRFGLQNFQFSCEQLEIAKGITVSYVPQDTSNLTGYLDDYIKECGGDPTIFKMLLRKLDFSREHFDYPMETYSAGQKKKVLIARSLSEQANLYIWDEPLNYIDLFSRIQIETLIQQNQLTMLLVEHDKDFLEKVVKEWIYLSE